MKMNLEFDSYIKKEIFLGWNHTKNNLETAVHVTHAIINIQNIYPNDFLKGGYV